MSIIQYEESQEKCINSRLIQWTNLIVMIEWNQNIPSVIDFSFYWYILTTQLISNVYYLKIKNIC